VTGLAYADPIRLVQNMPYDLRQVVEWIDQAQLAMAAPEEQVRLLWVMYNCFSTTASDQDLPPVEPEPPPSANASASPNALTKANANAAPDTNATPNANPAPNANVNLAPKSNPVPSTNGVPALVVRQLAEPTQAAGE
jgi:hypothetical protein